VAQPLVRGGLIVLLTGAASLTVADTLFLRNGDRIEGTLVGVSGSSIEFEERGRVRRYDRYDVRRIELNDDYSSYDNDRSSGNDGRRDSSGLRERTVTVNANSPWTDTGIEVRRNQEVRFRASGKVRWGPSRSDGPGGEGGNHYNAGRPLPDRPAASLIGRIGDRDDVFFVGDDSGVIRARDSGRLYLGVNDDYLLDNSGSFRVTVYY